MLYTVGWKRGVPTILSPMFLVLILLYTVHSTKFNISNVVKLTTLDIVFSVRWLHLMSWWLHIMI
jgi:hypothetical protein